MNDVLAICLKGIALGFAIAAPVGPIGLLCINRTLASGWLAGIAGGFGTAVADAAYASVAAFGLTAITAVMTALDTPLRVVGMVVLAYLGWKTWRQPLAARAAAAPSGSLAALFIQTFGLTITNPATILAFAALFAGLGLGADTTALHAAMLVAGTFVGSMAWWIILSGSVNLIRHRLTPSSIRWINHAAGALLVGFALWLAYSLVRMGLSATGL